MIFHAEKLTVPALPFIVMLKIMNKLHHGMIEHVSIIQLKDNCLAVFQIGR